MTFLKKLGQILLQVGQVALGFSPIIQQLIPEKDKLIVQNVMSELSAIASLVVTAESFGSATSLTGAQKLQGITPMVSQLICQSSLMVGKKIAQPDLFNKGASEIASGMADILNSLKDDVPTTSLT